jgi:diaminopimelate epimerase
MTDFFKMSGCGNDFIALVEPKAVPTASKVRDWCLRGLSLGADGVFALRRTRDPRTVEMQYWNSDGGQAALCLNGTRCAARLALHLGWAGDAVVVRTGAGDFHARQLDGDRLSVVAPAPRSEPRALTLTTPDGDFSGWLVDTGVPHFVCFRDEGVESVPIDQWSPPLRRHRDLGPPGANVDWVFVSGRHDLMVRSFERGIEGETLACGTGVLATAAAAVAARKADLPLHAITRGGLSLHVEGETAGGRIVSWEMAGEARLVAKGTLLPGADAFGPC